MDRHLAHPVAGDHLDYLAYQLGRGVVLVGSHTKTRDDLGLASLPYSHSGGRHSLYAMDRADPGRKAALAIWQSRHLRAQRPDPGGDLVHVVGADSPWTLLVELDHAQGGSSGHRHRPVWTCAPPDLHGPHRRHAGDRYRRRDGDRDAWRRADLPRHVAEGTHGRRLPHQRARRGRLRILLPAYSDADSIPAAALTPSLTGRTSAPGRWLRGDLSERHKMAWNNDALTGHQRYAVGLPVDLGKRPERQMAKCRELLQRIARTCDYQRTAVPQLDGGVGRNDIAKRHGLAFGLRGGRAKLYDLADDLLVDQVHLVDIDVRHVLLLRQVEAGLVALIALCRLDVAAAQNAFRQEDIDVALDIERHVGRDVSWIDRDNQAYRDVFGLQHFGEYQRTISAHRVPDQDDRSGILAILANRRIGDQTADREFVDVRRDTGVFDLFGQTVHPARKDRTKSATEQVGAPVRLFRRRVGGRRECNRLSGVARHRDLAGQHRIDAATQDTCRKHRP